MAWLKTSLLAAGALLVSLGAEVEPSESVWIMATAGGLLGVAITEDHSIRQIVVLALLGIAVAIGGELLVDALFHLPRPPIALLIGIGGVAGFFACVGAGIWRALH